jgi:hypothetical protein
MKMFNAIPIGLAATILLAGSVWAQTGSNGVFSIHNDTTDNTVIGFYTNDGTGWSVNWLSEDLVPGVIAEAAFTADTGACDQTLQVGWLGQDGGEVMDEPISIDICSASNVYLNDNEIYFD